MTRARWWCKPCKAWGLGGPAGFEIHRKAEHREGGGSTSKLVGLGFTGRTPSPGYQRVDIGRTPVMESNHITHDPDAGSWIG